MSIAFAAEGSGRRTAQARLPEHWVLLRGLGRESRHWFDFPARFARELGVRCHVLDLPGTGERRSARVPWSARGQALDLEQQLAERELAQAQGTHPGGPAGLLAISFGSMVALSWAALRPDRFSHLVIINGSARCSPVYQRLRPAALVRLLELGLHTDPAERERGIHRLITNATDSSLEAWVLWAQEIARTHPVRRRTVLRQLVAAARFCLPPLPSPCLILSSRHDRMVSAACSEAPAHQLRAPHYSHPSAGHELPLEDPAWVIERVRRWLLGTTQAESRACAVH